MKFCERLHPAEQLLAQLSRDIWTFRNCSETVIARGKSFRTPNADLEIILKDTHQHMSAAVMTGSARALRSVEGLSKLRVATSS